MTPDEQATAFARLREIARADGFGEENATRIVDDYEEALNALRVLWHAYTTDNAPPAALQAELAKRFGV